VASWPVLTVATAVWAAGHTDVPLYWQAVYFLQGLVLAWAYRRSGSLWTMVIAHAAWDSWVLAGLDPRVLACAAAAALLLVPAADRDTDPDTDRDNPRPQHR
jgi:membrane protease YdiL (CAAX protease family)